MTGRVPLAVICAAVAAVLCCCGAKKAVVSQQGRLPTKIQPGEGVVVLLDEPRAGPADDDFEERERSVERCVASAMTGQSPQVPIVPSDAFRRTLFPGRKRRDTARSVAELLALLRDGASRGRVEKLGIRYVVVVDRYTGEVNRRPQFDFDRGVWAVGETWTRSSTMSAAVLDARGPEDSGTVSSSSSGPCGYVVPVVVILPLPPVFWFARTETESCSGLGTAVASFLAGNAAW